jgi:hypothetical protein
MSSFTIQWQDSATVHCYALAVFSYSIVFGFDIGTISKLRSLKSLDSPAGPAQQRPLTRIGVHLAHYAAHTFKKPVMIQMLTEEIYILISSSLLVAHTF